MMNRDVNIIFIDIMLDLSFRFNFCKNYSNIRYNVEVMQWSYISTNCSSYIITQNSFSIIDIRCCSKWIQRDIRKNCINATTFGNRFRLISVECWTTWSIQRWKSRPGIRLFPLQMNKKAVICENCWTYI